MWFVTESGAVVERSVNNVGDAIYTFLLSRFPAGTIYRAQTEADRLSLMAFLQADKFNTVDVDEVTGEAIKMLPDNTEDGRIMLIKLN